jgi:ABC-2 type transport system permease protein
MTAIWNIAKREFASFFRTPLGWVVMALFLLLSGFIFWRFSLVPGQPASMREFFTFWWRVLMVISPAISMRLVSEEIRSGTIDTLLTSPAGEISLVLGKYFGAVAFLVACLLPTTLYALILIILAKPDTGPIFAGYSGVLLLGMLQLAIGLLYSSLTASQTLAFLATLFTLVLVEVAAVSGATFLKEPFSSVALSMSIDLRISDFAKGLIDTAHVVFFLVASLWMLSLSSLVLRARRWR